MSLASVFVVGDSISIHYGPYLEQAIKETWAYARKSGEEAALKDLDIPQGANGGDSSMVLAYLQGVIGDLEVDLLLVNCGLHDIKVDRERKTPQVAIDDYRENLQDIVELCIEHKQDMAWVRTTPVDEKIHNTMGGFDRFEADHAAYSEVADQVMLENGIPMIDLAAFTANLGGPEIYCDHVHFTEVVRQQQAAFIAGWLDAWFACRLR